LTTISAGEHKYFTATATNMNWR